MDECIEVRITAANLRFGNEWSPESAIARILGIAEFACYEGAEVFLEARFRRRVVSNPIGPIGPALGNAANVSAAANTETAVQLPPGSAGYGPNAAAVNAGGNAAATSSRNHPSAKPAVSNPRKRGGWPKGKSRPKRTDNSPAPAEPSGDAPGQLLIPGAADSGTSVPAATVAGDSVPAAADPGNPVPAADDTASVASAAASGKASIPTPADNAPIGAEPESNGKRGTRRK